MKKLIYLSLLILFSCKKEKDIEPVVAPATMHKIEITVESNKKHPFLALEWDTTTIKRINTTPTDYTMASTMKYEYSTQDTGKYRVWTVCTKNSIDSTFDMSDNGPLWNRAIVKLDGAILYDVKDTIPLIQHSFYFNIK